MKIHIRLKEPGVPCKDITLDFACEYLPRKNELIKHDDRYWHVEEVIWEDNEYQDGYVPWIVVKRPSGATWS